MYRFPTPIQLVTSGNNSEEEIYRCSREPLEGESSCLPLGAAADNAAPW
jgi:hypothetical protein